MGQAENRDRQDVWDKLRNGTGQRDGAGMKDGSVKRGMGQAVNRAG